MLLAAVSCPDEFPWPFAASKHCCRFYYDALDADEGSLLTSHGVESCQGGAHVPCHSDRRQGCKVNTGGRVLAVLQAYYRMSITKHAGNSVNQSMSHNSIIHLAFKMY